MYKPSSVGNPLVEFNIYYGNPGIHYQIDMVLLPNSFIQPSQSNYSISIQVFWI